MSEKVNILFKLKECISITWDKNFNVFGLSLKNDKQIIGNSSCIAEEKTFPERLKSVYEKLYTNQDQFIIIGGYIPSAVCFELVIPPLSKKEIEQYLHYELSRQLPFPVNDLKWCYRVLPEDNDISEKKIKIFAVLEEKWDELFNEIISSGIKVDNYIYPFFAVNPLFSDQSICFPGIEDDFFLKFTVESEDCYMQKNSREKDELTNSISTFFEEKYQEEKLEKEEAFLASLVLAEYFFTKEFIKDKSLNIKIHNELQPKRFKNLKIISVFLLIILLVLSGSYFIRKRMNVMHILNSLDNEKVLLSSAIKKINYRYLKVKKYDTAIEEIEEATPDAVNPIEYLQVLTKSIPGNIWMTSFASSKDKVNVTLQTNSSAGNITATLNKNKLFKTENVRKRKTSNGSQYIYLTLKSRQPDTQ